MNDNTVIAELSQGTDSVDLPLLAEGGEILTAVDLGKPDLIIHDNGGSLFPRVQDRWSGQKQFNLIGIFRGDTAHSDAIDLAQLVQSDGNGEPMFLDVPGIDEIESNIKVAPAAGSARALNINYPPGYKDYVEFDLGLTRVDQVLGSYNRSISTPTDTGNGPIQLTDGTTTIDLINDIVVDRFVGRPNDVVRKSNRDFPRYEIKPKTITDEFELSLQFSTEAVAQTQDIANLFGQKLGRTGLTLDFNGLYGYGSFDVVPSGTGALRHIRESGKEGVSIIPTISVERITI